MTFIPGGATGLLHVPANAGSAWWLAGDTYVTKVGRASTAGALGLVEASIPPGSGPPPHRHTLEDEAFYVLSGSLEIRVEQELVHAGPGDFVFLPRGAVHTFRNMGVDAARALIIVTPPGLRASSLRRARRPCQERPRRRPGPRRSRASSPLHRDSLSTWTAHHPRDWRRPVSQDLTEHVFRAVDSADPTAIVDLFAPGGRFVFGNAEPLVGHDAIRAGVANFLTSVARLRHDLLNVWHVAADTVAETAVTYQRHDGSNVVVPAVSIWHTDVDGLIVDYRVYVDMAPVYAEEVPPPPQGAPSGRVRGSRST